MYVNNKISVEPQQEMETPLYFLRPNSDFIKFVFLQVEGKYVLDAEMLTGKWSCLQICWNFLAVTLSLMKAENAVTSMCIIIISSLIGMFLLIMSFVPLFGFDKTFIVTII